MLQRSSSCIFPFLCACIANITVVIPIVYLHNILIAIYTSAPIRPYLILSFVMILSLGNYYI